MKSRYLNYDMAAAMRKFCHTYAGESYDASQAHGREEEKIRAKKKKKRGCRAGQHVQDNKRRRMARYLTPEQRKEQVPQLQLQSKSLPQPAQSTRPNPLCKSAPQVIPLGDKLLENMLHNVSKDTSNQSQGYATQEASQILSEGLALEQHSVLLVDRQSKESNNQGSAIRQGIKRKFQALLSRSTPSKSVSACESTKSYESRQQIKNPPRPHQQDQQNNSGLHFHLNRPFLAYVRYRLLL